MTKTAAVILAAGKGKRMHSRRPKVLHLLAGKPLVRYVVDAAQKAGVSQVVLVIGHGGEEVKAALGEGFDYAWQREQLGTGHAVMQAMDALAPDVEQVVVLSGDVPLLTGTTIQALLDEFVKTAAKGAVLTACLADPTGYGRIIRHDGNLVERIVEHGDASPEELAIQEINSGIYCFDRAVLAECLQFLKPDNVQGEYYLTDVVQVMRSRDLPVVAYRVQDSREIMGINNRVQLAEAESIMRQQINTRLMLAGVTMLDPVTTYIEAGVEVGPDTVIHPFTILRGKTRIGRGCTIGPQVNMLDTVVGDEVEIRYTVTEEAQIGDQAKIGPFAYLRPGTVLGRGVKVGDFVEIKKSMIDEGSKVPHLTYIGDAVIGKSVNVGAGTITCNYDGKAKHQTVIEDGAFIGSNSNLVAPIKIGANAYVAAGSTLTADVPAESLAVARERQRNIPDWHNKRRAGQD
ncbi:MAG TPA: bifunctional UDP-N-acetylglucosamine diphosphorylase/glucosamine-1-phosphate N-acetyltransferase GlmU [Clostridia bacterium]|nr:bifunctional UDP-N-acetylglucosamine diphosphorylase/glucosamine-1-phosphate N-acetyltransferase GlmU [Clostridia bacterium]